MGATVLIVDDSRLVRQQVVRALAAGGFSVVEAADGLDALEKLAAAANTGLIICDINMPRMGGLEFLEALRSTGSTVPVVMLTTEGRPELIQRAKSLGAKGWIVKPFKPEVLVATATKLTAVV